MIFLKLFKDTSVYVIGDVFTKGMGFISIIFFTHFLSQRDMGAFGYINIIIGFVTTFLMLGLDNAYARYFFEFKNVQKKKILTTTLFLFLFFFMILVLILPVIFYKELSYLFLNTFDYTLAFLFALVSLPLKLLSYMSNQALRNQFKTKKFVTCNLITGILTIISSVALIIFTNLGVASIFFGMIIGDFFILPLRLFFIKNLFIQKINFNILKKTLAYGIPFLPTSVAYWIFSSTDRVMLETMVSLESVGVYTVAFSLCAVMSLLASSIGQAWSPHAVKAYEKDKEKAKVFYINFLKVIIAVALFLIFFASMLGREIISFIFPSEYLIAFYPMLLLLIGIGFQVTTQVTAIGISLSKKTVYLVYITVIIAIINISLNYFLIPLYYEVGASFATMLSFLLLTIIYSLVSQKLFRLNYDFKYILTAFLILIIIFFASYLDIILRILLLLIVIGVIYLKKIKITKFIR
jgi:O-antigen/teichoic acid export membrane protein